jgi:DNA polymerase III alpha subunit
MLVMGCSAGYAAVAYRMAYLKTHYPAEFMAARLAVWGGFYRPSMYMSEARRLGLAIRPPHVNHSSQAFTLESPRILWMGLGQVRELTHTTIEAIMAQRPFGSLPDFLARAQPQFVESVNLVKAGALEGLGNAKVMLAQLEQDRWHGRHTGQMGLLAIPMMTMPEPTSHERAGWEREVLGTLVSLHPLQLVADELARHTLIRSDELSQHAGQEVMLAGVRLAAHRFAVKQEPLLLVDMEDEHGTYQVLWSGAALDRYRSTLSPRELALIRGRVRTDRQGQALVAGHEIKLLLVV